MIQVLQLAHLGRMRHLPPLRRLVPWLESRPVSLEDDDSLSDEQRAAALAAQEALDRAYMESVIKNAKVRVITKRKGDGDV
jgi:hypothetical protein